MKSRTISVPPAPAEGTSRKLAAFASKEPANETLTAGFIQRCLHDDLDLSQPRQQPTALFMDDETFRYPLF